MQANRFECLLLRSLYAEGIFYRGLESVVAKEAELRAQGRIPLEASIDHGLVLKFANMTETPPPTHSFGGDSLENKLEKLLYLTSRKDKQ